VPPTASSPWRSSRTVRTNHEPWSSRLARRNDASKSAPCVRWSAHTGAGFGGGKQQWRLWRVGQGSPNRRSGSSFVFENTPGSGHVRRGDSRRDGCGCTRRLFSGRLHEETWALRTRNFPGENSQHSSGTVCRDSVGLGCTGIVCSRRCLRPVRRNLAFRFISLFASTTPARSCVSAKFGSSAAGLRRRSQSPRAGTRERARGRNACRNRHR